jgi:DNA-binding response OmpR family regulator
VGKCLRVISEGVRGRPESPREKVFMDILIVEDNKELLQLLTDFLRAEGYTVSTAENGEKALSLYERYGARLVLLDINLPGMDGFAVCEKIRANGNTPIIMLTARVSKEDKLNGLILGADDYIEKPYDIDILIAKVKGIFKRRFAEDKLSDGDITLDLAAGTAAKNGRTLDMTAKEFELLKMLIENKGQTLTKERLFNAVWGMDSDSEQQTLTVHIKWLREKIEPDPKNPSHILTVWGKGYRWE